MIYQPYMLEDVINASNQKKFNVISTFAGGGGSSTGYRLAGGNILCINEFVEEARNTYRDNYPNTPILPDDIKELSGKDFLDVAGLSPGELDILDGSPPCSAFSISGTVARKGKPSEGWGKTKNYSDGKKVTNIEDLFFEFLRVANDIRPKIIIGENVAGLTIGESKIYFKKIKNTFEEIGYDVTAKVLDSRYFGISQTRQRVFFIGLRNDITEASGYNFLTVGNIFPEPSKEVIPLKDAFIGLKYDEDVLENLRERFMKTSYWATAEKMPINPDRIETGSDYHPKQHYFNLKRTSQYLPSPTITATGAQDSSAGAFHWSEPRKFTLDELKRIMSLPDDFKLTGRWNQRAERIGRMVPPLMMKALAESVYENVLKDL